MQLFDVVDLYWMLCDRTLCIDVVLGGTLSHKEVLSFEVNKVRKSFVVICLKPGKAYGVLSFALSICQAVHC